MSSLNKKKEQVFTHEGGIAKHITKEEELRRAVMSCLLWEDSFYESGISIADRIAALCQNIDNDKIDVIAREAKHVMKLRHVPLFLVVILCSKKYNVRKLVQNVVTRADDIPELLAIYWKGGKRPISKSLLRAIADSFSKFDEYALSKYKADKKAISLKNVIKLARPKPKDKEQAELWGRLVKGELKTPDTWEVRLSACKSDEEKHAAWRELVDSDKLGGLATLRNIRNMQQVGYNPKEAIGKINAGRLLPINFLKAAETNPQFEAQIEQKFFQCFEKGEKIKGETVFLFDVSGSMQGNKEAHQAGLAMIAREMFEDTRMFIFGNYVQEIPNRKGFALRDLVKSRGEQTYLGRAVKHINENIPYQRLIVVTDEQSHDPVPDPVGRGYMINIDTCKNGVGYYKWLHINGWSDSILRYITEYEKTI